MRKVFISGPYTAKSLNQTYRNIEAARAEATLWWIRGAAVFCPHLNSAWMDGVIDHDTFIAGNLIFLKLCDIAVFIKGWKESKGCGIERQTALEAGLVCLTVDAFGEYLDELNTPVDAWRLSHA